MRLPVLEHAAGDQKRHVAEVAVQWPSQRWSRELRERQTSPAPAAEEANTTVVSCSSLILESRRIVGDAGGLAVPICSQRLLA